MRNAKAIFISALLAAGLASAQTARLAAPVASAPDVGSGVALPQLKGSLGSSVTTVEELLRLENEATIKAAQKARVDSGLSGGAASGPTNGAANSGQSSVARVMRPVEPKMIVSVDAVFGLGDSLRADLTVDGQPRANSKVGARVGKCEIEKIANRCVVLRPQNKSTPADQCPTTCWTGLPTAPPPAGAPLPSGMVGAPLPVPLSQMQQ
jgi:hypothetical protein